MHVRMCMLYTCVIHVNVCSVCGCVQMSLCVLRRYNMCVYVCMCVLCVNAGERLIACVMYAALARGDHNMLVDVSINGGYKSRHMNPDVCVKMVRFGMDTWGKDLMEGKNMQQFIDECYKTDPWEEVADNLGLLHHTLHIFREVLFAPCLYEEQSA